MNINIKSIMATGERVTLECKKAQNSVPISLWDTYSAFANTYGGTILLGVVEHTEEKDKSKRFEIVGVEDADKIRKDLWNIINSKEKVNVNLLRDEDCRSWMWKAKALLLLMCRGRNPLYALFISTTIFHVAHSSATMKVTIIAPNRN